jgi:site-specific recombinase XerD
VSRANEIYNYDRQIKSELRRVESDINLDLLLRFYEHSLAEGLSPARVYKRLYSVRRLSEMLGMRFEDATKEDIVQLVAKIEQKNLGAWSKHDYTIMLKKFYRWLRNSDIGETPAEVRWLRASNKIQSKLRKADLLTPDKINRIIECATDVQDKAFFSVLFDSGRRLGKYSGCAYATLNLTGWEPCFMWVERLVRTVRE